MFLYKAIKESALNTYGWKSLKHLKWFLFLLGCIIILYTIDYLCGPWLGLWL